MTTDNQSWRARRGLFFWFIFICFDRFKVISWLISRIMLLSDMFLRKLLLKISISCGFQLAPDVSFYLTKFWLKCTFLCGFRSEANRVVCYAHPDAPLIEDYRAGDMICSECGLVVGDRYVIYQYFSTSVCETLKHPTLSTSKAECLATVACSNFNDVY